MEAGVRQEMAISHRIKPRYASKNHEIVANLREAAGAGPPMDPEMVVKRKAAEIAVAMALLHGGNWRPVVDHQNRIVLIRPD